MEITGKLSELPLPELLQFLDRRQVTGCLSLEIFSDYYAELQPQRYSIWLSQGHLVSVQRECYQHDVYDLAVREEWISPFAAKKLKGRAPQDVAAGLYLESQGILTFEQLRSLFFTEVVHRVEALCEVKNANFQFQTMAEPLVQEMTGLRIPAARVAEQGLRGNTSNLVRDPQSLMSLKDKLFSVEYQALQHKARAS